MVAVNPHALSLLKTTTHLIHSRELFGPTPPPPPGDQDQLAEKFTALTRHGSDAEKILKGFLFGVVVGLLVAIFGCCWLPCFRRSGTRPRQRQPSPEMGEAITADAGTQTQRNAEQTEAETETRRALERWRPRWMRWGPGSRTN